MVHGHAASEALGCSAGPRCQHEQGTAAPAAYETVSTTETSDPVGRGHTRWPPARARARHEDDPRLIPSTSPLVDEDWRPRPNREKGIARSSPPRISSPSARTKEEARPRLRRKSAGRQVREQRAADQGEQREAGTMPPMMAKGRRRLPPAEPPAAITGRRGSRKGDAGDQPPMKPITSNEFMRLPEVSGHRGSPRRTTGRQRRFCPG